MHALGGAGGGVDDQRDVALGLRGRDEALPHNGVTVGDERAHAATLPGTARGVKPVRARSITAGRPVPPGAVSPTQRTLMSHRLDGRERRAILLSAFRPGSDPGADGAGPLTVRPSGVIAFRQGGAG